LYGLIKSVETTENEPLKCASTLQIVVSNWKTKIGVDKLTLALLRNLQMIRNQILEKKKNKKFKHPMSKN
jgi:hypothetical protein